MNNVKLSQVLVASVLALGMSFPLESIAQQLTHTEDSLVKGLVPITGNDTRSVDLNIEFKLGSAKITDAAKDQLDALGRALKTEKLMGLKVDILGHTDASGGASLNKELSEKRAKSVRAYLISVHGINEAFLRAEGRGETQLLDGHPPNGAANRRVEIAVHAPLKKPKQDQADPKDGITAIN